MPFGFWWNKMRNLLSIFVLGLLMASCISMGQYNALPKDQMTWYDVHSVWMEAPVPEDRKSVV